MVLSVQQYHTIYNKINYLSQLIIYPFKQSSDKMMLNTMWHVHLGAVNWAGGLAEATNIYKIKYSQQETFPNSFFMAKWIRINQIKYCIVTLKERTVIRISNSLDPVLPTVSCFLSFKAKLGLETFQRKNLYCVHYKLLESLVALGFVEETNRQACVGGGVGRKIEKTIILCVMTRAILENLYGHFYNNFMFPVMATKKQNQEE